MQNESLHGHFVLLRAGALRLVLPLDQVGAASHVAPGTTRVDGKLCLALSQHLTVLDERPGERFIAATLAGTHQDIVWCWDDLQVMIGATLQAQPVPGVLLDDRSPLTRFVDLEGDVAYLGDAARIAAFALQARE
jgi:hypothetical protein